MKMKFLLPVFVFSVAPYVLAGLFSAGCGSNPFSGPLRVVVRTDEDTVSMRQLIGATGFEVTAIVRNDDSRVVQVALCNFGAQRDIDGTWTTLYWPSCFSPGFRSLAPGDSVVRPVLVVGYTDSRTIPKLDPRMVPGRYRLLFGAGVAEHPGATNLSDVTTQPSLPFIVK